MSSNIVEILENKNIKVLGDIEFDSQNRKIEFLNKLELFEKNNVKLPIINDDILNIINDINIDDETLKKLKKINWDDFEKLFESHDTPRRSKIYENFITFIRNELDIYTSEESLTTQKTLLENEKTNNKQKNFHKELYEPKENFNVEQDLDDKIKRFNVDVKFDYVEPSKKLSVMDFTLYFNRRLQYFTNLLSSRISAENITKISRLKDLFSTNTQVTIIGLISEINETKNGHYMLTIEDKSGQIKCFVNKENTTLVPLIQNFCLDEGIGVKGKVGDNIIWSDEFIVPSPPQDSELKKTQEEHHIVFISDLHCGAKVFQDEAFQKFIDWINGETQNEELNNLAKKVEYVIIPGDIIEGMGIYPNQGKDARILSTVSQYHEAVRWLSQIPQHIGIIIIPGNHDTDRLSEPQPKLPYHKAYALYNMSNVIMLSNPSIVNLYGDDPSGGLDFYMYHGGSFFYYADRIQHLRDKGGAKAPEEVVKFLLEKRHVAPSHGATLYFPDSQSDPLVIKKMPDFFVCGHTHKLSLANHKKCTIASCGCWVEMSDYQEKMGMYPDVGKAIVVNTKTRKPHILNFYTENYKKQDDKNK